MHRLGMIGLGGGLGGLRVAGSVRNVGAVAAVATVGSVAYVRSWPKSIPSKDPTKQKLILERPLMEAICGGVGEVAQICVMYPLETIKVKCQSDGLTAAAVIQQLLAKGLPAATRALYAGFLSAAVCSVLVGSIHYASFCISKRMALQATGTGSGSIDSSSHNENLMAAAVGALATALVESPVELFRHQAQAGVGSGNFLQEMVTAVQRKGPGALYWGFVPFLIESFPYDLTELGTYSQLSDMKERAVAKSSESNRWVTQVPDQAWDIAIGAAAGVASVLISMPFDVIKTYMQTHGVEAAVAAGMNSAASEGAAGQVAAFVATGRRMVALGGPGALFVGLAPRLVQQVPSTMICWWAIERCRNALEPYTKP